MARTPTPPPAEPTASAAPGSGSPLSGLLRGLRRARGVADPAPAGPDAGGVLRTQAEVFQTLSVGDVMTPRADILGLELSTPFEEVVAAFVESEHTRLPIYRETLDDPVGLVHLKDLFKLLAARPRPQASAQVLSRIKRPTLYIPPSMRAADLLLRMQASRIHMVMVIDEFGGVDGLVTLEDLLESVVGEIDDEHDEAAAVIVSRPGGAFEIDGRAEMEDLERALGVTLTSADLEEEIDTAAGLVTALAGRVPERGEVIAHPAGFEFEVTDADPRRVKRLRVRPLPAAGAE